MGAMAAVTCGRCNGDPSALRLIVTESVWYLLDVTDQGIDLHQPEAEEPTFRLVCLECGHEGTIRPNVPMRMPSE